MEIDHLNQLATLSHAARMRIFRLLMRRYPDTVPAGEITSALDLKPSTASAHLSALKGAGLIQQSRAGTSLRYSANLDTCRALIAYLVNDCCRARPDLCDLTCPTPSQETKAMAARPFKVLFICVGNSARSIFAEALLRERAGDRFEAYSAGLNPASELNPIAVQLLQDKGFDTSVLSSKTIETYQGEEAPAFDFVFTVCDKAANEECPAWPGQPITAHWSTPDPVKAVGTEAEKMLAFQHAFAELKRRIEVFSALPFESLDRIALQHAVDTIEAA